MMEMLRGSVTAQDWMAVAVILGITVVLVVVFFFFVASGQQEDLQALIADDARVVQDVETAKLKKEGIAELREKTAQIEQLVDEFEDRLPSERELTKLVRKFEGMASDVGLDVELTPLPSVEDPELRKETIPYNVVVYGTFHQIAAFVNRLEQFERYLKISDLRIEEQKSRVSKAAFTLSTYRFLQPTPGAAS
ncbi:MAG: type 4a pilus biogenesis protein PilO [Candidatus Hydrogenedentes bacterium]|nr:type 4a pilus biogenesis protein PilO [Candidatus Hydrogenedentota bacterium]